MCMHVGMEVWSCQVMTFTICRDGTMSIMTRLPDEFVYRAQDVGLTGADDVVQRA